MLVATPSLDADEGRVLELIGEARSKLVYSLDSPRRWTGHLRRTAMARAVQGSNTIEGYNITVEDAIAIAQNEEPLEANKETEMAVSGYQRALTYVLQLAKEPAFEYSARLVQSLHFMMLEHDLSKNPGLWRPGWAGIRNERTGDMIYEGADSGELPVLMGELIASLNAPGGIEPTVKAAMAHLNLVLIHPFSDGNGRMARCLQTLVLARGSTSLDPVFISIEEHLGKNTPAYYDVLKAVAGPRWSPSSDARPWVRFCLTAHYRQVETQRRRQREIQRLWDSIEEMVQRLGLPDRTIYALADAAFGWRVRNATYRPNAEVSHHTASRDLKALVDAGLLLPRGERRGRYYVGGPTVASLRVATREPRSIPDPFVELQQRALPL